MFKGKREPFNPGGPFVVRRGLTMNGVRLDHGSLFPISGCKPRRVRQLWDMRRIDVSPDLVQEAEVETEEQDVKEIDWRTLVNRDLFKYVFEQAGVKPRNRKEAFEAMELLNGPS